MRVILLVLAVAALTYIVSMRYQADHPVHQVGPRPAPTVSVRLVPGRLPSYDIQGVSPDRQP